MKRIIFHVFIRKYQDIATHEKRKNTSVQGVIGAAPPVLEFSREYVPFWSSVGFEVPSMEHRYLESRRRRWLNMLHHTSSFTVKSVASYK